MVHYFIQYRYTGWTRVLLYDVTLGLYSLIGHCFIGIYISIIILTWLSNHLNFMVLIPIPIRCFKLRPSSSMNGSVRPSEITLYEEDKKEEASMRCSLLHGSWDQILRRCPSVHHTFLTMFPSSYHHEIFRSYYQWQMWRPCNRSKSEVKGQGHWGQHPT